MLAEVGDFGERLPASLIIDQLILLARNRSCGTEISNSYSAVADTVRYLSTALGQISIRKDYLEALQRNGTDSEIPRFLQHQSSVLEQLKNIWVTAFQVQDMLWDNLAAVSYEKGTDSEGINFSLGISEENIMFDTVLGRLAVECVQSIKNGFLREDLCPKNSMNSHKDGGIDIKSVIDSFGISDRLYAGRISMLVRGCFP